MRLILILSLLPMACNPFAPDKNCKVVQEHKITHKTEIIDNQLTFSTYSVPKIESCEQ